MKKTLTIVAAFSILLLFLVTQSCKHDTTGPDECVPKTVKPDTSQAKTLALLQPLGCETFYLGDSVELKWTYYNQEGGRVAVELSLQGGADGTFEFVWNNGLNQLGFEGGATWGIPDSAKYLTDNAVIRIHDYDGGFDDRSNPFSIKQR